MKTAPTDPDAEGVNRYYIVKWWLLKWCSLDFLGGKGPRHKFVGLPRGYVYDLLEIG